MCHCPMSSDVASLLVYVSYGKTIPVANLRVKLADTDSVKVQGSNKPSSSVSGGMTLFHLQRKMLLPQRLEAAWAPINSLRLSR